MACDVVTREGVNKGVATELAPHEILIELAAESLPGRGSEVALYLQDAFDGDPIELRGAVLRVNRSDATTRGERRGVRVRIDEAPMEYHALFGEPAEAEPAQVEILIDVGPAGVSLSLGATHGVDSDLPMRRGPAEPDEDLPMSRTKLDRDEDLPTSRTRSDGDADLPTTRTRPGGDADLPAPRTGPQQDVNLPTSRASAPQAAPNREAAAAEPEDEDASGAEVSVSPEAADETSAQDGPAPAVDPPGPAPAARSANAIVVYDGDTLQDVYDLLEEIGAKPQRARLSGPTAVGEWDQSAKMVVIDVQNALSAEVPPNLAGEGVVRIAIASSASAVIGSILRSQGFHYLVRRPLHRDALEVLLRHVMYREDDRRAAPRSPLGIDARLGRGRFRWPVVCTVLELSSTGCRVVTLEDFPHLSVVWLRISRAASGTRSIAIPARVIRRRHDKATGEWSLALRFQEIPAEQRGRLDGLLERSAIGPTSPPTESPARRVHAWLTDLGRADTGTEASHAPVEALHPDAEPMPERRHRTRATLEGEVVALDQSWRRVTAVLRGRDLSTLGMRVEPHPEFSVGQRMLLAFYDRAGRGTIQVSAEVIRDDGPHGLALKFVDMDPRNAARLGQLVDALPAVESLVPTAQSIVVARIVPEALLELREEVGAGPLDPSPAADSQEEDAALAPPGPSLPTTNIVETAEVETDARTSSVQASASCIDEAPAEAQPLSEPRRGARRQRRFRRWRR